MRKEELLEEKQRLLRLIERREQIEANRGEQAEIRAKVGKDLEEWERKRRGELIAERDQASNQSDSTSPHQQKKDGGYSPLRAKK